MMQNKDSSVLAALNELRDLIVARAETGEVGHAFIMLQQAFDRLYVAYHEGKLDASAVLSSLISLRTSLASSSEDSTGLRVGGLSFRDKVLSRNYRFLAERLLSETRGSWDSRKLELAQSSIAHIASHGGSAEAADLVGSLQARLSESVWTAGFELAETRSQLDEASQSFEASLMSFLAEREQREQGTLSVDDSERELLKSETHSTLRAALSQADAARLRHRVANVSLTHAELLSSEAELKRAEEESLRQRMVLEKSKADRDAAERIAQASEAIRLAGRELLSADYKQLGKIQQEVLMAVRDAGNLIDASEIDDRLEVLSHKGSADSVDDFGHRLDSLQGIVAQLSADGRMGARFGRFEHALSGLRHRQQMLASISSFSVEAPLPQYAQALQDQSFVLEARAMYEQQLMRFERDASAGTSAAEMLKALDYDVVEPNFTVSQRQVPQVQAQTSPLLSSQWRSVDIAMKRVRHIAQSSQSGDVGLYAPLAGAEQSLAANQAVSIADNASPFFVPMATIYSEDARRSNRLMSDAKQLAYHPSLRADMGFASPKYQIDELSARPLFKRVRFNRDDKESAEFLPMLYRVADIKMKGASSAAPLRKSARRDLDLSSVNLDLIKTIESQFDNSMAARTNDGIDGIANQAGQYMGDKFDSHKRVIQSVSNWVENRHDQRRMASDTASLAQTGRMNNAQMETSLRTEGTGLPTGVQRKLQPFLGFDISKVKVFSGPIADMASDAMGAQAFTLGKNIFFGKKKLDFNTPEGLGLLAHELLHTSHFNSGSSVDSKESEAEAIEARVKSAFGSGSPRDLAVEGDRSAPKQIDQKSSTIGDLPPNSVGHRHNLTSEVVFDDITRRVLDMLTESVNKHKERKGGE